MGGKKTRLCDFSRSNRSRGSVSYKILALTESGVHQLRGGTHGRSDQGTGPLGVLRVTLLDLNEIQAKRLNWRCVGF